MISLDLIKIFGLSLVIICCIVATYTDVKRQIIPNKLTFTIFILGISLGSIYYYFNGIVNIFYYVSILIVFVISYTLWYLGVWAGGDVKLFTALSTLFIPDFLSIINLFNFYNFSLPVGLDFLIPTLLLIFNSILSVIPLVLIIITYKIIKEKRYLINEFVTAINYYSMFISLNSLLLSYQFISLINIDGTILKMIFFIVISLIISKVISSKRILLFVSVFLLIHQIISNNIIFYIGELVIISSIFLSINLLRSGLIKKTLTDYYEVDDLKEGMILAYPLCNDNEKYYFNTNNILYRLIKEDTSNILLNNNVYGLTVDDIHFLDKLSTSTSLKIPIKKALPFAPFILCGLIITLTLGNTYLLFLYLMGVLL